MQNQNWIDAIINEDLKILERLAENDLNPELEFKFYKVTPLLIAAWENKTASALFLIEKGANWEISHEFLDPRDRDWAADGNFPIHFAAQNGNPEIVKALVEAGDDPNRRDRAGLTPLMWACRSGNILLADYLLQVGADLHARMRNGYCILNVIATDPGGEKLDMARWAIEKGAGVNIAGPGSYTPLLSAVGRGYWDIARLLVRQGADITARTEARKGLLELAPDAKKAQDLIRLAQEIPPGRA